MPIETIETEESLLEKCRTTSQHRYLSVKENKREFRVDNDARLTVATIKIDGCYITDNRRRCDYLFELGEPPHHALYVELKGKNIEGAYEQLLATLTYFGQRHKGIKRLCYIIASRVPKTTTPKMQQLRAKLQQSNVSLEIKTNHHTSKTSEYVSL
jgi:hypothetical protein